MAIFDPISAPKIGPKIEGGLLRRWGATSSRMGLRSRKIEEHPPFSKKSHPIFSPIFHMLGPKNEETPMFFFLGPPLPNQASPGLLDLR